MMAMAYRSGVRAASSGRMKATYDATPQTTGTSRMGTISFFQCGCRSSTTSSSSASKRVGNGIAHPSPLTWTTSPADQERSIPSTMAIWT